MNDKDSVMDGVPTARVARRRRVTVIVGGARMRVRPGRLLGCLAGAVLAAGLAAGPAVARTSHARPVRESPVTEISRGCFGDNAEVEEATAAPDYVYELWIGCHGIGFARSADGGLHFGRPVTVPGSRVGLEYTIAA